MIRIPDDVAARTAVLVGSVQGVSQMPTESFCPARVEFLAALSRRLLKDPRTRALPDVASFAYWCRAANLKRLAGSHALQGNRMRMGLGLTFHICPANVPVNFAFSLAFGLLAGNSCVLRLPSKLTPTADLLVEAVGQEILKAPDDLRSAVGLLRFERDDEVTRFWMSVADGRIVWGGDETVAHMRTFRTKPRSREVAFADRYSLCALNPSAVVSMDEATLLRLCGDLFNDIYLMDQAACSSPQLFAWVGDQNQVAHAQAKLWPALAHLAQQKYVMRPVQAMDKFVQACRYAMGNGGVQRVERHGNVLYRLVLASVGPQQHERRGYFGTVHEVAVPDLDGLGPIVNERYQTLTIFGIDPAAVRSMIRRHGLKGIDRVMPVGHALDMDSIWDGYDIIASLSRLIPIH